MRAVRASLFAFALLALTLAGCISEKDDVAPSAAPEEPEACLRDGLCGVEAVLDETGRDLRTDLTANDTLRATSWVVGDVFEQHLYYGSADTAGEHIVTMVTDTAGDCYQFGTTSKEAARTEAVFDLPILGCITKRDLATSAFDTDWGWMYEFPLTDGKSWTGEVNGLFNWNRNSFHSYAFTLTATYAAAIDTPLGDFPGFEISGMTEDDEEFLRYNYVPAIGWFSHFWMYDLSTEAADDIMFHAMSMGRSTGFTGTYYIDESTTVFDSFYMPPVSQLEGDPPEVAFTVPDDATYLKGIVVPIACLGASKVILNAPGGQQKQFDHQTTDAAGCAEIMQAIFAGETDQPDPRMYNVHWFDEPAVPGEWQVVDIPSGLMAGYYIWLEAVNEVAYTIGVEGTAPIGTAG